jgi:two-component sensor histidine kinase
MSLLYDKMYRSSSFSEASVRDYLSSLVDEVVSAFPNGRSVTVRKRIGDFKLDAKRLQPLGILVNELLTNVMKYAFDGRPDGRIGVSADDEGGRIVIAVEDDGVGVPESVSFESSTGFGLELVQALARQLDGAIRIERGDGTRIVLEFER